MGREKPGHPVARYHAAAGGLVAETTSTARFLWRFARPEADRGHEREVLAAGRNATVFAPDGWPAGRPAWVLLHGVTVPGRHHDALRRFARSLAAAGHYAVAPEVGPWRSLAVDPEEVFGAVDAGLASVREQTGADPDRVGVVGFSVAGRWALNAAAERGKAIRAVAAMGGYWDIERTLRAMVLGEHDWRGQTYTYDPDPYGRWIMGANLLPLLEGDEFGTPDGRARAADALRQLATVAGQNGAMAREAVYDPLNAGLRETVAEGVRPIWDVLAPPSGAGVEDPELAAVLVHRMAQAGLKRFPLLGAALDPARLVQPVVLLHGRSDRLIPFTETLRLAQHLPAANRRRVTITRLFGHTRSRETRPPWNPVSRGREAARFAATVESMLSALE